MKITPKLLKLGLNMYVPYIGAGIKVKHISKDWRKTHVSMKLRWFNKNIMKTHFGGSLYAMVDPHLMLMLMQVLGKDYQVWDKSADIDFVKPGKGTVQSILYISDDDLSKIKFNTNEGKKYFHRFNVEILDSQGDLIANVKKILYIKKKQLA
ncbi:MAG: DUF4442 domain-containing protein [Thermodesulfobacteriota bacterium]|nr:DUF4442 domain-containing protein [Thermodesulfobacteriota bacterium]